MMKRSPLTRKTPMARGVPLIQRSYFQPTRKPKKIGLAQSVALLVGTELDHKHSEPSVFRSVQHRQNVAALRCICCGIKKNSQAAHLNLLALGKGMGWKLSDALTIPLCRTRLGIIGCHVRLDSSGQYDRATSEALQLTWLHKTRDELKRRCQWEPEAEADMIRFVGAYLRRSA